MGKIEKIAKQLSEGNRWIEANSNDVMEAVKSLETKCPYGEAHEQAIEKLVRPILARTLHKSIRQFEIEGCPDVFDLKVHIDVMLSNLEKAGYRPLLEHPECGDCVGPDCEGCKKFIPLPPEQISMGLTPEELKILLRANENDDYEVTEGDIAITKETVAKVLRLQSDRHPSREAVDAILNHDSLKCADPTAVGLDDCGYESGSPHCLDCQLDQICALFHYELLSDEEIIRAIDSCGSEDIMFDPREYLVELRAIAQAQLDKGR